MKRLLIICSLVWLSCEEEPPQVLYGEPFELAYGESQVVEVGTEEIEVGFQAMLGDSRCPLDVFCKWEGWARIQLWLHRPGQDTIYLEPFIYGYVFQEDTTAHESIDTLGYRVTLLQLDPYPTDEFNDETQVSEYEALLVVSKWESQPSTICETFTLPYGESQLVKVGGEEIEIGFQAVLGESRCPLDVDCFWEGRARIQLRLRNPGQDTIAMEPFIYGYVFKEDSTAHKRVFSEEYAVALLQLDPYPSSATAQPEPEEYIALLSVSLNPIPLETDRLNLFAHDVYEGFLNNPIDGFYIDSSSVTADTLRVYVAYSGGCKEHDFFLFGSTAWAESAPPQMSMVIIHDGHWDMCEAWIHKTLRFDLSPIRTRWGSGESVFIHIKDAPDSVLYHY